MNFFAIFKDFTKFYKNLLHISNLRTLRKLDNYIFVFATFINITILCSILPKNMQIYDFINHRLKKFWITVILDLLAQLNGILNFYNFFFDNLLFRPFFIRFLMCSFQLFLISNILSIYIILFTIGGHCFLLMCKSCICWYSLGHFTIWKKMLCYRILIANHVIYK